MQKAQEAAGCRLPGLLFSIFTSIQGVDDVGQNEIAAHVLLLLGTLAQPAPLPDVFCFLTWVVVEGFESSLYSIWSRTESHDGM